MTATQDSFGFVAEQNYAEPRDNWRTPDDLYQSLDAEFGFTIDAAANEHNHKCAVWYGPGSEYCTDTLDVMRLWPPFVREMARANIWLNPPFTLLAEFTEWANCAAVYGHTVVMVMPAHKTGMPWWHRWVRCDCVTQCGIGERHKADLRFLLGRTAYVPPPGIPASSPAFSSMVAVYRPSGAA